MSTCQPWLLCFAHFLLPSCIRGSCITNLSSPSEILQMQHSPFEAGAVQCLLGVAPLLTGKAGDAHTMVLACLPVSVLISEAHVAF